VHVRSYLGKAARFIVSEHGIEINPKKISTIIDMELVKKLKGAHRLTLCLAMLNRFISRLEERGMPLYMLLKKSKHFEWTQETLDWLKSFLTMLLVLTFPSKGETLLLYTATTPHTVSAALVVEQEEESMPSKPLSGYRGSGAPGPTCQLKALVWFW
jgi:hypothetical protein